MKMKTWLLALALIAVFASGCSFQALTGQAKTAASSVGELQWAFTNEGQHPEQVLVKTISGANASIDMAIYSLTHPDIVKAVLDAKRRGLAVRIITDKQQSSGRTQKQALKMIKNAGIPIKINSHSGLMHLKVTIIDGKTATTGSFNYSKAASTVNDEVLMVVNDVKAAASFEQEFQFMWKDAKDFANYE